MGLIEIEKGDTIATKDGRTIRVLAVYKNDFALTRIEGIDDSEATPMRRPVFSDQIARLIRKAPPKVETGEDMKTEVHPIDRERKSPMPTPIEPGTKREGDLSKEEVQEIKQRKGK